MTNNRTSTIEDFGDALIGLISEKKFTYGQVGSMSKLSATYIFDIAKKKVQPPKDENLIKIAKTLGVKPEYFFEYRLRRLINLISDNREYLDLFLNEIELSQKKRRAQKARVSSRKAAEGVGKVGEASK